VPLTVIVERVPSESLPVVVMVGNCPFVDVFRNPHGGESLAGWDRGGGGIRVFGRALAYEGGLWKGLHH